MVKNRAELISMSKEWTKRAMSDLRGQIISFMENVGTDGEELAYALGITVDELNAIVSGGGEISLSTFAKILIATDNVIEIKPISATPFGGMEEMPNPSMLPMGMRNGRIPHGRKHAMPQMTESQPRDSKGRFTKAKQNGAPIPSYDEFMRMIKNGEIPEPTTRVGKMPRMMSGMPRMMGEMPMNAPRFDGMPSMKKMNPGTPTPQLEVPRRELVSTIVDNGWDDEIDIMNSTSAELMEFLMSMGLTPNHFERMKNEAEQNNPINESKKERVMQMLSEELDKNPHLFEQIKRFTDAN